MHMHTLNNVGGGGDFFSLFCNSMTVIYTRSFINLWIKPDLLYILEWTDLVFICHSWLSTLSARLQVKPVPSGSSLTATTFPSLITREYLQKNRKID